MYIRNKAHSFPFCFRSFPLCFTPSNWLRNRGFVSPYSGFGSGLFISTGPVLFTGSGEFRGLFTRGFRGLCLCLVIHLPSLPLQALQLVVLICIAQMLLLLSYCREIP